ncbi:MAG: hypothetical protein ACXWPM_09630 [Bdellovibrionota bacterium]
MDNSIVRWLGVWSGLVLVGSAVACQSPTDPLSPRLPSSTLFEDLGLSGEWQTACIPKQDGYSQRETITLQGNDLTTDYRVFDDTQCTDTKVLFSKSEVAGETYQQKTPELPGWSTLDYLVKAYLLTPEYDRIVTIYNRNQTYGYGDWQLHVPKDISGRKFDGHSSALPTLGEARVRSFTLQGDKLKFAKYVDGKAQESEDESLIYTKK